MERKSFVFYKDWKDAISDLPDDIRLEIYESIIEYAVSGAFQGLKPMAKIAFNFIKTDLDRDIEKYQKVINRNKENIGKRWGKENTKNTSGISGKTENTKNTDNDNDNDNVSKENNSSDEELQKKAKNPPLSPPDDLVKDQSQDTVPQVPPPTPTPDHIETEFNEFWEVYDKKTSRAICLKKWRKLSKADRAAIFRTLLEYVKSTPDKQYRKNPETYLNQRGWEMEIIPRSNPTEQQDNGTEQPPNFTKRKF